MLALLISMRLMFQQGKCGFRSEAKYIRYICYSINRDEMYVPGCRSSENALFKRINPGIVQQHLSHSFEKIAQLSKGNVFVFTVPEYKI